MGDQRFDPGEARLALQTAGIEIVREAESNREIRCRCPRHDDPSGHLYVNSDTGAAFCQKCQMATHLMELCRLSTSPRAPATERRQILDAASTYYAAALTSQARTFLVEERGIPKRLLDRFRVGWADGGLAKHLMREQGFDAAACIESGVLKDVKGTPRDFLHRRIVFPNVVQGRVVHMSARALGANEPKWLHLPGQIGYPYNADALAQEGCVWVEGILDVLSVEAMGHPASAGLGTHFKAEWSKYAPGDRRVYVCLDGDAAGAVGCLAIAGSLGHGARIVSLPSGTDPNDLLVDQEQRAFDACLERSVDPLTYRITCLPRELRGPQLREALEDVLTRLAEQDPATMESYIEVIAERFELTHAQKCAYRQTTRGLRKAVTANSRRGGAENRGNFIASFDGLVDIVDCDGAPAFLTVSDGVLEITWDVELESGTYGPPPVDGIPWPLPSAQSVLRWYEEDTDTKLYDDLVDYYRRASELPTDGHYHLLAAWTLHTYLLEQAHYSPIICLYAVPERGKTRTGKAMIHAARRGIHVESLRDAYLVRFADRWGGSVFFDVMDLWKKAERECATDVLLSRFERGLTVPRVNRPDQGPHCDTDYYQVFGPTIIGTNRQVHHILDTRALTITMPRSSRAFEDNVTPEAGLELRERLVAFRARHLCEKLPEITKPAPGRLGDITKPLVQVVRMTRPRREAALRGVLAEVGRDRLAERASSMEADILRAILGCRDLVERDTLAVRHVVKRVNEDRPPSRAYSPQLVGRRLRSLGFKAGPRLATGTTVLWDEDVLSSALDEYGVSETPQTAQSAFGLGCPEAFGEESAECVVPPGSREGAESVVDPCPSEWSEECREAYEERLAIMMEDGGLPEDVARELALEDIRATHKEG